MGPNPIQKRQMNYMLGGIAIGLIVTLLACLGIFVLFIKPNMITGAGSEQVKTVAVLNKNIKSGSVITPADYTLQSVNGATAPADAVGGIATNNDTVAKIDLTTGTVLATSMLTTQDAKNTKDLREQEYNMISLPTNLVTGDYIDIRLQLPDGGDYIVVSKKTVQRANASTVWLKMTEEETLVMSNAIIEYYIMAGSKLYATRYTDPGSQEASTPTYYPNNTVIELINSEKDINITSLATGRYSNAIKGMRKNINTQKGKYSDTELENIETKLQEEIKNLKESRAAYFGALNSAN